MLFRNLSPITQMGFGFPMPFDSQLFQGPLSSKVSEQSWSPVDFLAMYLFPKLASLPQMYHTMLFPFNILSPARETLQSPTRLICSLMRDGRMVPFVLLLIQLYCGSKWFIHRLALGANSHCVMTLLWKWQAHPSHRVGGCSLLPGVSHLKI